MCSGNPGGILGFIKQVTGKGGKAPVLSSGGVASLSGLSAARAMSGGGGSSRKRAAKLPQVPLLGSTNPNDISTG